MKSKKQRGEIATALAAFLLGAAWAALVATTDTCQEGSTSDQCTTVQAWK